MVVYNVCARVFWRARSKSLHVDLAAKRVCTFVIQIGIGSFSNNKQSNTPNIEGIFDHIFENDLPSQC